jgi:pSer/pThr/pTyr-binding forkhead associated (FHA) protein
MRVVLRKVYGEGVRGDVIVTVPDFLIGRSPQCHLRLLYPAVSRMHCELIVRDGYVAVRDLGSKNGTYVNNCRVLSERKILSGDHLNLGTQFFEVVIDELGGAIPASRQADLMATPAQVAMAPHILCEGLGCLSGPVQSAA